MATVRTAAVVVSRSRKERSQQRLTMVVWLVQRLSKLSRAALIPVPSTVFSPIGRKTAAARKAAVAESSVLCDQSTFSQRMVEELAKMAAIKRKIASNRLVQLIVW